MSIAPGRSGVDTAQSASVSGKLAVMAEAVSGTPPCWTRRLFEWPRISTVRAGLLLLGITCAAFFLQELALGRVALDEGRLGAMREAVIHIVITIYAVTAYVYSDQARDECLMRLRPLTAGGTEQASLSVLPAGRALLLAAGVAGSGLAVLMSIELGPGQDVSYDPRTWGPESGWDRVGALLMGFWTARLSALVLLDSASISRRATRLREIDLLDLTPLSPLTRHGLTGALLLIGSIATYALFLVDIRYLAIVGRLIPATLVVGGLALFLPLRGARTSIRRKKLEELAWVRDEMRAVREQIASGQKGDRAHLDELVAWEARIQSVHEWPVDASTYARFALYLLIPLGSWAGGALVERIVDSVLD